MSRVDDLLLAPRGRALCAGVRANGGDVFAALADAVALAAYWQSPLDAEALATPEELLRPEAERLLHSTEIGWWRTAAPAGEQWCVRYEGAPARFDGTAAALERWRAAQADAAWAPEDLERDDVSGTWWSAPIVRAPGLPNTTRGLPDRGPAGLWLVEDELGWRSARCWPVAAARDPRVFEVHGPEDWGQLARAYPFDVTDSRSPDWRRATGRSGRWVIPDWAAVAADYDAVHVSVWGWLTTAGRPVAVNGAATLLAGWSPDETYWLADCLAPAGEPVDYVPGEDGWVRR